MFGQILKQWMWDCYDHLGRLLAANMIVFLILLFVSLYGFRFASVSMGESNGGQAMLVIYAAIVLMLPLIFAVWFAAFGKFGDLVSAEKDPGFRVFLT